MSVCTRRIEFDAGHRICGHESKCAKLHGHRYVVEITARGKLDSVGRVIDFGVLKQVCGGWIDNNWDHRLLLWNEDQIFLHSNVDCIFERGIGIVRVSFNPTAENMAEWLLYKFRALMLDTGVEVIHVRVYETPNCWADCGALDG